MYYEGVIKKRTKCNQVACLKFLEKLKNYKTFFRLKQVHNPLYIPMDVESDFSF